MLFAIVSTIFSLAFGKLLKDHFKGNVVSYNRGEMREVTHNGLQTGLNG